MSIPKAFSELISVAMSVPLPPSISFPDLWKAASDSFVEVNSGAGKRKDDVEAEASAILLQEALCHFGPSTPFPLVRSLMSLITRLAR